MKPKAQYLSYRDQPHKLEQNLRILREVKFKYRKANGQFRYARGRIPLPWPRGGVGGQWGVTVTKDGREILIYWDIDRGAVRSFYTNFLL